jgi:hypothetical protein
MTCLSIVTEDRPATVAANPIFILSQVDDRRGAEIAFEVFEEDTGILNTLIGKKCLYYINPPAKMFWGELTELETCISIHPALTLLRDRRTLRGIFTVFGDDDQRS